VKPNAAHIALAKFSIESIRKRIAPDATFALITQNVDGLSTRALEEVQSSLSLPPASNPDPDSDSDSASQAQAPQPQILEMHGRVLDVLCGSEECGHRELVPRSPICDALRGTEELVESGAVEPIIDQADLPHCTKCGALARPGVVWFGEVPIHLDTIDTLVDQADLCLVVGTSSTVSLFFHDLSVCFGRGHPSKGTTGVPCGWLHAHCEETWWEGRHIQCGEEQQGPNCGFLVYWPV
jgi:NAD-dependent deacetylase sirtuin 5